MQKGKGHTLHRGDDRTPRAFGQPGKLLAEIGRRHLEVLLPLRHHVLKVLANGACHALPAIGVIAPDVFVKLVNGFAPSRNTLDQLVDVHQGDGFTGGMENVCRMRHQFDGCPVPELLTVAVFPAALGDLEQNLEQRRNVGGVPGAASNPA